MFWHFVSLLVGGGQLQYVVVESRILLLVQSRGTFFQSHSWNISAWYFQDLNDVCAMTFSSPGILDQIHLETTAHFLFLLECKVWKCHVEENCPKTTCTHNQKYYCKHYDFISNVRVPYTFIWALSLYIDIWIHRHTLFTDTPKTDWSVCHFSHLARFFPLIYRKTITIIIMMVNKSQLW